MIVTLKGDITSEQYQSLIERIEDKGLVPWPDKGTSKTVVGIRGDTTKIEPDYFMADGVESVTRISTPYKLVSREFHPSDYVIDVSGVKIGNGYFAVIAGPCSVESEEQLFAAAKAVKEAGAQLFRGGAFKPRTSPYAFQGLGEEGLGLLVKARDRFGLPVVTEIMSEKQIGLFARYDIDMYQVGARNMQNFDLLKELGRVGKPVLLKRGGLEGTIENWLSAAEYIVSEGNPNVVLCERGVKGIETKAYRNTLDLNAVAAVKRLSYLPVIADPSHGTGNLSLIPDISLSSIAAGANGLLIEVHPDRRKALSDAHQQLSPEEFGRLMKEIPKFVRLRRKIEKLRKALG
ncbi:MAG: 3-deoxy-7-phosphoheptulonate synthase [Nanoarchaeota archaeon]|nr:3-deoxy-7-phosphoheptulonate synthase [Nanoarchaeota archaeon]